jgi:hypothetical protein
MRARRFLQRLGKEFGKVLLWCLVAYAPFGVVLGALMGASLSNVLVIGGIIAAVLAALITALSVGFGGVGDPHPSDSRPYDYDPHSDRVLRSGGGYGVYGGGYGVYGGWDGGGGDGGGGGGGDGGGGGGL